MASNYLVVFARSASAWTASPGEAACALDGKSMWIPHEEFGPELKFLLKRRSYAEAVSFWKGARPLAQRTVPSTLTLTQLMETDPPCLAFLNPREREEIQVAAGFAALVGATRRMGRFVSPTLKWPHQLSKDAAVHNLLAAFQIDQLVSQLMADERSHRIRVKVQNSCEGACITCLLASSRDFPLEHCPPVPIVGCVNYEAGCRCSLVVTSSHSKRDTVSWLS